MDGAVSQAQSGKRWLEASFWALPTDRHRHMFLDTAILFQAQPVHDLRCAWTAMLQINGDCVEDPDAAARIVDGCRADLVESSLISINEYSPQKPWWEDVHRCDTQLLH